jgi:putative aldouronate transport system substrate-binding protein
VTACSSPAGTTNNTEQTQSESSGAQESETQQASETPVDTVEELKPVRFVQPGTYNAEYEVGLAAINEKLKNDGVGIELDVIRIPWDAYAEKLNLMLTSGEPFELLHIMQDVKNLSSIAGIGAVISLEPYLDNYPDLLANFTDIEWSGTLYNGERYAVPCYWRSFDNTMSTVQLRTDVMKAVGYDTLPTDIDQVIDMMKKSQDYILDETGIKAYTWFHQVQDTSHWLHRFYDTFPFYVENSLGIVLARQDGTIDSFYESEEFKQDAATYRKIFEAGLINPDIMNLDHQVQYDQADLGAFLLSPTFEPIEQVTIKRITGMDTTVEALFAQPEKPDLIYTFVQNINAVSSTAEDPESGLKLLEWLYKSKENHDLFHYGIEGQHYNPVGDDRIEYIRDADDKQLFYLDTWMTGYLPLMRFDAESPDAQIEMMTYKSDHYVVSPIAGFIFDSNSVATELTNLQTELISSIYPIKLGIVDYDSNIGPAIEKLKAAGLDKYLEEYRKQFTAYYEANPNVAEMAKEVKK